MNNNDFQASFHVDRRMKTVNKKSIIKRLGFWGFLFFFLKGFILYILIPYLLGTNIL